MRSASRPGSVTVCTATGQLVGQHRRQLDDLLEQRARVARERLGLEVAGRRHDLRHRFDPRAQDTARSCVNSTIRKRSQPLDDQADRAVRLLEHPVDRRHGPDRGAGRPRCGILGAGSRCVTTPISAAAAHRLLEQPHRRGAARRQRQHRLREQHGVPQRQDRRASREPCGVVLGDPAALMSSAISVSFPLRRDRRARAGWTPPDQRLASCRGRRVADVSRHIVAHVVRSAPRSAPACRACGASSLR